MTASAPRLPAVLEAFPAAILQLDQGGVVQTGNGRLEHEFGRDLAGSDFAELLDLQSSGAKWQRILESARAQAGPASDGDAAAGRPWELILRRDGRLLEPRAFSALWDAESEVFWLIEHPRDPRLDRLGHELTEINSELAGTQRELVKERARLARTLAELERSNAALDEFAHVVSHDLKAPLRAIANYAEWAAEDQAIAQLEEQSRDYLRRVVDRARRMRDMIDGVLAYARAGREQSEPETVRADALVQDVLKLLDPPAETTLDMAVGDFSLTVQRAPLTQVLLNLISNALRHAGHEAAPRVRIEAEAGDRFAKFVVTDNGPGIEPALQDRIWELFRTADEASGGTGVGLAVVRKLVEAAGGGVEVRSEPGAGAAFRFTWPRVQRSEDTTVEKQG